MLSEIWTLLMLILLEIIFNADNLIFIFLVMDKTPITFKKKVLPIGIGLALLVRFVTLIFTFYVLSVQNHHMPYHTSLVNISVRDLLMIAGGSFLIFKCSMELWNNIVLNKQIKKKIDIKSQLFLVILQIILIDLTFSIDSLLTSIALTRNMSIIAIAYTFSMLMMMFLSGYIARLIKYSPNLKVIAVLFILFVGMYLILEGFHIELPKEYLYSSLIFALLVESISRIKKT
ncbi:MAG: TerC family protein [Wolbachia endosymbiont of Meromenopon meropis]|nr:TerC family protein [Wolbachia endosymbiont of Meromenopon meropis]